MVSFLLDHGGVMELACSDVSCGAAHFANPNSSAEAYILHRMQQNDHLQSYCGAIGRDLSRDPSGEAQNVDFSKILGMASPGVEYVPTSLETIFKLPRGP